MFKNYQQKLNEYKQDLSEQINNSIEEVLKVSVEVSQIN
jgi:hypothetical protein